MSDPVHLLQSPRLETSFRISLNSKILSVAFSQEASGIEDNILGTSSLNLRDLARDPDRLLDLKLALAIVKMQITRPVLPCPNSVCETP